MTTVEATATVGDVLGAVRQLAPTLADRAPEIEAARRMPADLLDDLIRTGCFRLLRPHSHGGIGADAPGALGVLETLARADASTAWVVMIGSGSWLDLAGLPREGFDAVFADPDTITAGAFNPTGSITEADGGYRVSGRWSFASGCEHADWIYGNCIEVGDDGREPRLRIAVFAPDQVVIEDTWMVSGLCGTGSHHFHVDDVLVPAESDRPRARRRTHARPADPAHPSGLDDRTGDRERRARHRPWGTRRHRRNCDRQGAAARAVAARDQPAVRLRPRDGRHRVPCRPRAALRRGSRPPGTWPLRATPSTRCTERACARRPCGSPSAQPRSSTPPTGRVVAARSTPTARSNAACATCTRSHSTSW